MIVALVLQFLLICLSDMDTLESHFILLDKISVSKKIPHMKFNIFFLYQQVWYSHYALFSYNKGLDPLIISTDRISG